MSSYVRVALTGLVLAAAACAKAPPETAPAEPVVGYYAVESHTCYAPVAFDALSRSEMMKARVKSGEEAKALWRGEVDPAIRFSDAAVAELDERFLQHPLDMGPLLAESQRQCEAFARGDADLAAWEEALLTLGRSFDQGRCEPSDFGYLSTNLAVAAAWQLDVPLCRGQVVTIAISNGRYSIDMPKEDEKREPVWIDADGAPDGRAGDDAPCPSPTCRPGQVIGRFVPWEGDTEIFPVGKALTYTAPAHGTLSLRINDDTLGNNHFYDVNQLPDFLLVEIRPAAL